MLTFTYQKSDIAVRDFGVRKIRYAFHDIDGTHSLIREWQPVMSIVLHDVSCGGVPEGYDSDENVRKTVEQTGKTPLPETDRFCVESAGLSALTQMEWAIRRAIDGGKIDIPHDAADNRAKIEAIRRGVEVFETADTPELSAFLALHTPRLFRFYEKVLNGYCRDKNLALAKKDPARFTVPGSKEFLAYLQQNGVKNYFVTGAVVEKGVGMQEEVEALGFKIGAGERIEALVGSTWTEKLPKDVIMKRLLQTLSASGDEVLVVGDGRSEIAAGVEMGALCISRLAADDTERRALHQSLGTDLIVENYLDTSLYAMMRADGAAK